jgi:phage shock protein A
VIRLRRRREPPAPDPAALVGDAYQQRLAALERLRSARAGVVASRARADHDRRSALAAIQRHEAVARRALDTGDEKAAQAAAARCVPLDAAVTEATATLESLAETDAVLDAAVTLVEQQLDTLRRQRARVGSATDAAAALAGVRADLEALAVEFAPVLETLTNDERAGPAG